jgi:hypothetical protein
MFERYWLSSIQKKSDSTTSDSFACILDIWSRLTRCKVLQHPDCTVTVFLVLPDLVYSCVRSPVLYESSSGNIRVRGDI